MLIAFPSLGLGAPDSAPPKETKIGIKSAGPMCLLKRLPKPSGGNVSFGFRLTGAAPLGTNVFYLFCFLEVLTNLEL